MFANKATTTDPEGFNTLDVVTTTPAIPAPADGLVGSDVALISGLASDEHPSWAQLLDIAREERNARGVLTYVIGGHETIGH